MHDEHDMYRVQWPALRRQLYHLGLNRHGTILLDALRDSSPQAQAQQKSLQAAVNTWCQAILAELAEKVRAADAWPGWRALMPLFGDTARLVHDLDRMAAQLRQEQSQGRTVTLWNVLRAYFAEQRDALDGAGKTRLQVWRKLDRIRHDLHRQRRRQGLDDYQQLPELVAHILEVIETRGVKDAPTTIEGVLSYFYEFDPAYAEPYNEELHGLDTAQELTSRDWQLDLRRVFEKLPPALQQALEIRFELRPQPVLRTAEERRIYYGCSDRTLRDRADRALHLLRQSLSL
jgi:hypothetical protein